MMKLDMSNLMGSDKDGDLYRRCQRCQKLLVEFCEWSVEEGAL